MRIYFTDYFLSHFSTGAIFVATLLTLGAMFSSCDVAICLTSKKGHSNISDLLDRQSEQNKRR